MKRYLKFFLIMLVFSFIINYKTFASVDTNVIVNELKQDEKVFNEEEHEYIELEEFTNTNKDNLVEEHQNTEVDTEKEEKSINTQYNQTGLVKIDNVWRMVIDGKVDYTYTGIGNNDYGTWFVENGEITKKYIGTYYEGENAYIIEESKVCETVPKDTTGLIKVNNSIWRMVVNGKVDYTYTGIGTNDYGTWFFKNGEILLTYTGNYKDINGNTWIITNGRVDDITQLQKIDNVWRMVVNGKVDYTYTGIGNNDYGTWFVENGEITKKYIGTYYEGENAYIIEESRVCETVPKDTTGLIKVNNSIWRMVVNGKVDYTYTGIEKNEYGTWFLEKGQINFKYTGNYKDINGNTWIITNGRVDDITQLQKIDNVWIMVVNGKVDYTYTGIGTNEYGTWFVENGEITKKYIGTYYEGENAYIIEESRVCETVPKDTTGLIKVNNSIWRMVVNGKVDYTYTGIGTNDYGTWFFKNGEIFLTYTGTYYEGEYAYIIDSGKVYYTVSKDESKFLKIGNNWRMVVNGKIDYTYTGLGTNDYGTWLLENGKINFNYIGIYKDTDGSAWVIREGKVENITGLVKVSNVWKMVVNGKVDYTYTGIGTNEFGTWLIENGEITKKYIGTYYEGENAYIIEESRVYAIVSKDKCGLLKIADKWRMVVNGKVDYTYTGIGNNDYGTWLFKNGEIVLTYSGLHADEIGNTYTIKNGKVIEIIKNVEYPGTMWVDEPINNNKYIAGNLSVSGWALSDEENDIVKVYLDDKYVATASRKERPDVFEVYSNNEYGGKTKNPNPGYYCTVNTKGLSKGAHTIKIVNYSSDGKTVIQSRVIDFYITDLTKSWGIDVSQYQGVIDWNSVKNSGVEFAILRIGYYLESKGQVVQDPYFEQYYNECKRLGIAVGGYFYSYAFNSSEASREAQACLSIIRGKHFEMPIFLDVEDNILKNAVANGKTNVTELTNASITFCETMNNSGFRGGVYASKNFFNQYLNASVLEKYNIWLAQWTTAAKPDYTGRFDVWQYTNSGSIPGINGNVDCDWCFTRYY